MTIAGNAGGNADTTPGQAAIKDALTAGGGLYETDVVERQRP
jgi:hypothetical protein